MRRIGFLAALAASVALVACGDDGGDGKGGDGGSGGGNPTTSLVVGGYVKSAPEGSGMQAEPLAGADVTITVDRNRDGTIAADEKKTTTSADDGKFRLELAVERGQTVVVAFRSDGMAPLFRTIVAGPRADVRLDVALRQLETLGCEEEVCEVESKQLSIKGLPSLDGSARVFNPVTEAAAFPGGFGDVEGNLLISGVFSSVELRDGNGDEVDQLDEPVELRMQMPRDTWNVVVDIYPGNDRIDVPLYAFDETIGNWVRDGEAHLEDANGRILAEDELDAVRDGSFEGQIFAAGEVEHFSYWNVDWPVESHGCITGRIVGADGAPLEGATVSVSGLSYTGSSTPVTVGADGRFCVQMMRSEGPGEDVDQDGTPGETHQVQMRVAHGGKLYDLGAIDAPAAQGTCEEGGCLDLGDLELTEAKELTGSLCTITGTVVDIAGNPLAGAMVWGFDEELPQELMEALCGQFFENCDFMATTAEDGTFTFRTASFGSVTVEGWAVIEDGANTRYRFGATLVTGCPQQPITVRLDEGTDFLTIEVSVSGNQITWTDLERAQYLFVDDGAGGTKWMIAAPDGTPGFASPVTYGVVPAGAEQAFPWEPGEPVVPLASGDRVEIHFWGTSPEGYTLWATGSTTVP